MMLQFLTWLEGTRFSMWLVQSDTIWAYPTVLTLHTVGLALLVGASTAVDLRVLGFGRKLPIAALSTAFSVMWIGFWVNAISGAMLFAGDATTKGTTTVFQIKLGMIALGVATIWLIKRALFGKGGVRLPWAPKREARRWQPEGEPPVIAWPAKALAVTSLLVWMTAIALGRFMAYV